MDRIQHLHIFVRVAHSGNFSQAASQLGISRAAASSAIQHLEEWLGTRLLHRTTRQVSLTRDGEELLSRAVSLITKMDELRQEFHPDLQGVAGKVRVDMPSRIARCFVVPALPDFFTAYPGIELELSAGDRITDLAQEGVDCALRVGQLNTTNVVVSFVGMLELINCASPTYLARYGKPERADELDQHLCVNYISSPNGRIAPWEWVEQGEVKTRQLDSITTVNNADIYIASALAGMGMIQAPRFDVQHHLDSGDLVELMPQCKPLPMPVHLVYPSRHQATKRVKSFTTWLEQLLSPYLSSAA
ncbi:LysR family transcriptional regulator [Undibacterium sp. CY7W]|uniref:LysR family transcriptional regulator n=1 Tax=Undibacterium rugosum TaxID=2762291 RepID=A0A923I3H5_9BURK|nr:LysR family transcriptional regulator [Undibacterium rugosum]